MNAQEIFKATAVDASRQKQLNPFAQELANMLALKIKQEFPHLSDKECGKRAKETVLAELGALID